MTTDTETTKKPHPADGMTAHLDVGDGAIMTLIDPRSFVDGSVGWHLTWGNVEGVRYVAAGLLESYDYLLSNAISATEAKRRLKLLRAKRKELAHAI